MCVFCGSGGSEFEFLCWHAVCLHGAGAPSPALASLGGPLVAKMKRHRSGADAALSRRTGAPLLRRFCAAFVVRYAALIESLC